eukprot:140780-Rhodomonas_salina.1
MISNDNRTRMIIGLGCHDHRMMTQAPNRTRPRPRPGRPGDQPDQARTRSLSIGKLPPGPEPTKVGL